MRLPKDQIRAVFDGRKTTHRVPLLTTPDGTVRPCRWKPGRDYAVQRPAGGEACRVEVLEVTRGTLGDVGYREARAEGHKTTAGFADAWMSTHDRDWPPTEPCEACDGDGTADCPQCWEMTPAGPVRVHALDAHPCGTCDGSGVQLADAPEDEVLARFAERHAATAVWVIRFKLADAPRLLAADSSRGYTPRPHDAMPDEPEAVDPDTLDRFARDAHARRAREPGVREEALRARARSLASRLRQTTVAADRAGLDTFAVLEQIEAHIAELERARRTA